MGTEKRLSSLGLAAKSDCIVTGLAVDSRNVKDGFLFAALPGSAVHGGEFVQYALRQGATAILTDPQGAKIAADWIENFKPSVVVVDDPRRALAAAASLWFEVQPKTAVAVTGTNGKTSVSTFCRQLWILLGRAAVNLGTTGVEGAWSAPLAHTTPEPITLHRTLAAAA
ncbi:MAG: Mur ligase domain-containing protein, partial [Pseudomonadota bacterium]